MVSPSSQALILIVPFSFSNHNISSSSPLSSLIKASSVDHYLNQIKLLNFFFHSSFSNSIDNLLHVVKQISSWMTSNLLFMSKFSSITAYMRDMLHWLPISQQIQYRVTAMVSCCVLCSTPLTFATAAAQYRLRNRVGCCVLLRGASLVPRAQ